MVSSIFGPFSSSPHQPLPTYSIMIPPESDMSVIERESKIKEEDEAPWGQCNATTQIKMTFINATQEVYEGMGKDNKHNVAKVVIESYNQYGLVKTQGGDEFYITYFSHHISMIWVMVAMKLHLSNPTQKKIYLPQRMLYYQEVH